MRDLAGFALLLLSLALSVVALVLFALFVAPFIAGILMFLGLAIAVLRRGRLHPAHLECLLKPRMPLVLAMGSMLLPAVHTGLFAVLWFFWFGSEGPWPWILAGNTLPCLVWTARMLWWHRKQKSLYRTEAHDLEDLLDLLRAREATLEVRADALEWVAAPRPAPEPWELVAGALSDAPDLRAEAGALRERVEGLRAEFAERARRVQAAIDDVRSGRTPPPHPAAEPVRADLPGLDRQGSELGARAAEILSDARGGLQRWELEPF